MRELKFRAWDKQQQRMFPVHNIIWSDSAGLLIGDKHSGKTLQYLYQNTGEVETMQSTGVTDCNGLDIYDGDIVRITHTSLLIPANTIGVVSYACARYVIDTHAHTHGLNMFVDRRYRRYGKPQIEVVGNVWEHPGLAPKK